MILLKLLYSEITKPLTRKYQHQLCESSQMVQVRVRSEGHTHINATHCSKTGLHEFSFCTQCLQDAPTALLTLQEVTIIVMREKQGRRKN